MTARHVYTFGNGKAEGDGSMRELLGGKGANLAEMCALGLPVPPGFTITTEVCAHYYAHGRQLPGDLPRQVEKAIAAMEESAGRRFGDPANPLLVSVRSGSRASMPGMMDTVLNLGLNAETVEGLAAKTGNARFAWDSYRRFVQMYSDVVLGIDHYHFEELLDARKQDTGAAQDNDLGENDLRRLVGEYKEKVAAESGAPFPEDPHEQLWGAIRAVFNSWMNQRAVTYRRLHGIPESWGTAVSVQSMVFGNMGEDCATGVAFTRNPSTGEKVFYGEFLVNAQGEDVVAGIRTPQALNRAGAAENGSGLPTMEEIMPQAYAELVKIYRKLEAHYRDMQDIEFTVENKKLWMLQTRNGKRTAAAALRIAVEMAGEQLIGREEAVARIDPLSLDQLLHPTLDPKAEKTVLARGLPASPGAASGAVVFSAEEAESRAQRNEKVILVRIETSPEDIHGMHAAQGILTARGGMTSHAAVVARGMGKPCVSGAGEVRIDYKAKQFSAGGQTIRENDWVTINGSTGEVILGDVPTIKPELSAEFATLMGWADAARVLKVRANAETPADARAARDFGAEGIGLCRTEHMFFDAARITPMREMILSDDKKRRKAALDKLLPMQRSDFAEIFRIMAGMPVTIRLLDPPLHEFLPHTEEDIREVASAAGVSVEFVRQRCHALKEENPMLGHRGCRLGVTYPEIYAMQARAIFEAAAEVEKELTLTSPSGRGRNSEAVSGEGHHPNPTLPKGEGAVFPEIMVPLVMDAKELRLIKALIDKTAEEVFAAQGNRVPYLVGTMIELPRAALRAGDIAETAEFFSFGTNDLTQTALGLSRDDSANFIEAYRRQGILEQDPFVTLDINGVGELVKIAAERGRAARKDLKLGICGEHGGDPATISFCHETGLNYVSCSPYRVPIARLAAAQAALKQKASARKAA